MLTPFCQGVTRYVNMVVKRARALERGGGGGSDQAGCMAWLSSPRVAADDACVTAYEVMAPLALPSPPSPCSFLLDQHPCFLPHLPTALTPCPLQARADHAPRHVP